METISSDAQMIRLFTIFGLSKKESIPIIRIVKTWVSSMGLETTVRRLKDLKAYGLTGIVPHSLTWIKLHPDGTPKGVFKPLWRLPIAKALNILDIYTNFVSEVLTASQWAKFYESATCKEYVHDERIDFIPMIKEFKGKIRHRWSVSKYDTLGVWTNSPTKRAEGYDSNSGTYVKGIESDLPFDFHIGVLKDLIITDGRFIELFTQALEARVVKYHSPLVFPGSKVPPRVGSISIIQERGLKARIVANPHRVFQLSLSKLGNFLNSVLRDLPWDCTFNQDGGIEFVKESLASGKTVYSIDLSDATNYFPLDIQDDLLKQIATLIPSDEFDVHRRLFLFLARGVWSTPKQARRFTRNIWVRWTQGQPLGLYPSFALFALTHGLVIRGIEQDCNVSNTFRVLGDDVVINEPRVAQQYRALLDKIKVPVSDAKTLVSNEIGEFAGKLITRDGSLPIEKWKRWSRKDIFSVFRWLGIKGAFMVPKRYRAMMLSIVALPEPIGLGLNPKGISLSDRLEVVHELVQSYWTPDLLTYSRKRIRLERERDLHKALTRARGLPFTETPLPDRTDSTNPIWVQHLNEMLKDLNPDADRYVELLRGHLSGKNRGWKKWVSPLERYLPFFGKNQK